MPSVYEGVATPIGAALAAGLRTLSNQQTVVFTQYTRRVLPLDGYVFWVRSQTTTVEGSLHVAVDSQQNEDETIAINRIVFSTMQEVERFNDISPSVIWVGMYEETRFAFSRRAALYRAAGEFHYVGDAVYPVMETQLVDSVDQLNDDTLIVSNSLPAWLTLESYCPVWLLAPNPQVTLFPSFLAPDNLRPPYGTVHIEPRETMALQPIPSVVAHTMTPGSPPSYRGADHYQLSKDRVRVTLYGLTNQGVMDWLDLVNQYSRDYSIIGILSVSPARDEKRTQNEINVLAMKKTVEFEVSYNQVRINDVARQLILSAQATFFPQDYS